jgi:hypothetical protein
MEGAKRPHAGLPRKPATLGRLIYEDRGARISIMAKSAQGTDNYSRPACDQLKKIHLQIEGGPYVRKGQISQVRMQCCSLA